MEPKEKNHIVSNKFILLQNLSYSSYLISYLEQEGHIWKADIEKINATSKNDGPSAAIAELLDRLTGRPGSYDSLLEAARILRQSGAVKILEALNLDESQYEPARSPSAYTKYSSAPSELHEFLAKSNGTKSVCLLSTPDTIITCDKLRERLDNLIFHEMFKPFLESLQSKIFPQSYVHVLVVTESKNVKLIVTTVLANTKHKNIRLILVIPNEVTPVFNSQPGWKTSVHLCTDSISWADLTPLHQQEIQRKLEENFNVELLEDDKICSQLFQEPILTDLIHGKGIEKLFTETLPEQLSYYVEREMLTRHCISLEIFQERCPDIFLFLGMEPHELSNLTKTQITDGSFNFLRRPAGNVKHVILQRSEHFEEICDKAEGPVHLLRYADDDEKLVWIRSRGNLEVLQKFVDKAGQMELDLDEFIENLGGSKLNQPVCISDSPGMGKTILLGEIGRKLRKNHPERIVVFFTVDEFMKEVNQSEMEETSEAIKRIIRNKLCGGGNVLGEKKLESIFKSNAEQISMELLLDGFDELRSSDSAQAYHMMEVLSTEFKFIRLWITTRPHFLEEVESRLGVLGFKIKPFQKRHQIRFLTSYWSRNMQMQQTTTMFQDKLIQFADKYLTLLKTRVNSSKEHDIAGIPLLCLLIGEVYKDEALLHANSDGEAHQVPDTILIQSITDLYRALVNKKFQKYSKSFQGQIDFCGADDTLTDMHISLSLQLIFPNFLEPFQGLLFPPVKLEEVFKVGIVESTSQGRTARFIHRTFAEYFVARFLVDKLRNGQRWTEELRHFFLESVLESKIIRNWRDATQIDRVEFTYPVINYFTNSLMADDLTVEGSIPTNVSQLLTEEAGRSPEIIPKLAMACAYNDFFNIFKFFDECTKAFQINASSIFNEEFIMVTIQHASLELVKLGLLRFEENHQWELDIQSKLLHGAVSGGHFKTVEFLLNGKKLRELLENFEEAVMTLLHTAVKDTNKNRKPAIDERIQILRLLVGINRELLEEADAYYRTPLLSLNVHVRLLTELIWLGADASVQDLSKTTVLTKTQNFSAEEFHSLIRSIPMDTLETLVKVAGRHGTVPLTNIVASCDPLPETLEMLKEAGADFNYCGEYNSLLATAVICRKNADTLRNLVRIGGSDVRFKESNSDTLLHIAVRHGNTDAILYLVDECGLDLDEENGMGLTPLASGIKYGKLLEHQDKLLQSGLVLQEKGARYEEVIMNSEGQTLLHEAAHDGRFNTIRVLLQFGVDINRQDNNGNTPLHHALQYKKYKDYFSITKLLLDHQANPNLANQVGETPFQAALKNTKVNYETIQLLKSRTELKWTPLTAHLALLNLLEKGRKGEEVELRLFSRTVAAQGQGHITIDFNFQDVDGNSLLHYSVQWKYERATKFLAKKGADFNARNSRKETLLHKAILLNETDAGLNMDMIKYLIDQGVDVYAQDEQNLTFLHTYICQFPDTLDYKLVQCLVDKGHSALFNTQGGKEGSTPLQLAIIHLQPDRKTLALLHSTGVVDFNAVDHGGCSVLAYAIKGKASTKYLSELIEFGADWKALVDHKHGSNVLHISAQYGTFEALKFFLELGELDVNQVNGEGNTPHHCALLNEDRNKLNILKRCRLLIEKGVDVNMKNNNGDTPLAIALNRPDAL